MYSIYRSSQPELIQIQSKDESSVISPSDVNVSQITSPKCEVPDEFDTFDSYVNNFESTFSRQNDRNYGGVTIELFNDGNAYGSVIQMADMI